MASAGAHTPVGAGARMYPDTTATTAIPVNQQNGYFQRITGPRQRSPTGAGAPQSAGPGNCDLHSGAQKAKATGRRGKETRWHILKAGTNAGSWSA